MEKMDYHDVDRRNMSHNDTDARYSGGRRVEKYERPGVKGPDYPAGLYLVFLLILIVRLKTMLYKKHSRIQICIRCMFRKNKIYSVNRIEFWNRRIFRNKQKKLFLLTVFVPCFI